MYGMTAIPPTGAILVLLSVHGQAQVTIRDICPMRQHDVTETERRYVDSTISYAYVVMTMSKVQAQQLQCERGQRVHVTLYTHGNA